VTNTAGRPIKGICVMVNFRGGWLGTLTSAKGYYEASFLPAGRYTVQFAPTCGFGKSAGNWAPQWYRGKYSQAAANQVTIRAGKITRGIGAVMRRGGQITGVVTGKGGARLSHVCVDIWTGNGKAFVTDVKTVRGRYRVDALDAGRYKVYFDPACGFHPTPYLGQWWPGVSQFKAAKPVIVRLGAVSAHVSAALRIGGTITGTVRLLNANGKPLAGICVFGQGLGAVSSVSPDATTRQDGSYVMEGLPAGRYTLQFGAVGCGNNGNYVYYNDPHPVRVSLGHATTVNVFMQPGAILEGKVTSAATGQPLGGICVGVNDQFGDGTVTSADGTYSADQIPPGRYSVSFFGGCRNKGSYAPQWFPGRTESYNGARVRLRAGAVTSGIDAAMRPGSAVSGFVTSRAGAPLRGICVGVFTPGEALFFGAGFEFYNVQTRRDGAYLIQNLAPGQYQAVFFSCGNGPGWSMQWYRSRTSQGGAGLIDLPSATTVTGIDAALARGGAIAGTVRTPSGSAFSFICITATNLRSGASAGSEADSFPSGFTVPYSIVGLAPGKYSVEFQDCGGNGYVTQWYRGKPSAARANPVTVAAGHATKGISARLTRPAKPIGGGGSISGQVTDQATGRPVPGICITAGGGAAVATRFGRTNSRGDYTVGHLASGRYALYFSSCSGSRYATQRRPGRVRVRSPHAVRGVNFAVSLAGSISGTVLGGQPTPVPLRGVCVTALPLDGGVTVGFGVTGQGGRYVFRGLAPGTYQVSFDDMSCSDDSEPFADQWYNGQTSQAAATPVTVSAGQATTGIGATLLHDGTISGTVTIAATSAPLAGICVEAAPLAGNASPPVYTVSVSSSGSYSLTGLPPGKYLVIFSSGCGATGYARQYWQDATSSATATMITVAPGSLTPSIDAAMHP
jgi:hypothetical protein